VKTFVRAAVAFVPLLTFVSACRENLVPPKIVTAEEFRLTAGDRTRASLAMEGGGPALTLFDEAGHVKLRTALDAKGLPSVSLYAGDDASKPAAVVEVDDKGTHILLRGSGGHEAYLFQKTDGTSGVVLAGDNGAHRGELKLDPNGSIDVTLFAADGKPAYSITVTSAGAVQVKDGSPK